MSPGACDRESVSDTEFWDSILETKFREHGEKLGRKFGDKNVGYNIDDFFVM